jgi:hypothetical protein
MFDSNQDLIRANNRALSALNQCLTRLNKMAVGASFAELSILEDKIDQITSQMELLTDINIHLEAAIVEFEPLDAASQQQLQASFARVEQAIVQNEIIGATIDTINDVFTAASNIANITNGAA